MALKIREYRDPADGRTYLYDEGDEPKGFTLVETEESTDDVAARETAAREAAEAHKAASTPANKAAPKKAASTK